MEDTTMAKIAESGIEKSYQIAAERYGEYGVDVEAVLAQLARVSISIHCWQGDDVTGFEGGSGLSGSGTLATGNYPGKARNVHELRSDLEKAYSLIPGKHRLNLHASYLEGTRSTTATICAPHLSWASVLACITPIRPAPIIPICSVFIAHPYRRGLSRPTPTA
jgi:L-rhamnose isomerase